MGSFSGRFYYCSSILNSIEQKKAIKETPKNVPGLLNRPPDEGGGVHDEHLVVGVDVDRLDKVRVREVGQEVEDVLQLVRDLVVHGQLPVDHLLQVLPHLLQLDAEALEGRRNRLYFQDLRFGFGMIILFREPKTRLLQCPRVGQIHLNKIHRAGNGRAIWL